MPEKFFEKLIENFISLGPVAILYALAMHEAWNYINSNGREGDYKKAIILAFLGTIIAFLSNLIRDVFEEAWKSHRKVLANWLIVAPELIWLKLTNRFQSKYYQRVVDRFRDYKTQGLKTKGPFVLNLEKIFVPLLVVPEVEDRISSSIVQSSHKEGGQSIWEFLVRAKEEVIYRRIAVVGPPGSGKTTMLHHLAITYAQNTQRKKHPKAPKLIPILIQLRDIREEISSKCDSDKSILLEDLICTQRWISSLEPRTEWFKSRLKKGQCLVMLDGLDEVANDTQRREVSRWVSQQIEEYPKTLFILTSRPFGYSSAPVEEVNAVLEVRPFDIAQVQQFIHNWYLQNEVMSRLGQESEFVRESAKENAEELINRIKNSSALASLALNPLLLTMIATVHHFRGALPGRRVELYTEICDVVLGRRQDAKGIPDELTVIQKKAVLQCLALALMQRNLREFSLETGKELISKSLNLVSGNSISPGIFLDQIEKLSGIIVERENNVYEFSHLSFQEFLAATEVKEKGQEKILESNLKNDEKLSWWAETIRLYAAQSDASRLIEIALEQKTAATLSIALDCLEEGLSIEPAARQHVKNILDEGLESPSPEIFQMAAQVNLLRRLGQLVRISDDIEIDSSFVTNAEYYLFLYQTRNNGKDFGVNFDAVRESISAISYQKTEEFCAWLGEKGVTSFRNISDDIYCFYRLPTEDEASLYPLQENKRSKNLYFDSKGQKGMFRIVRQRLSAQYDLLRKGLASQEWEKANSETESIILQYSNEVNWLDEKSAIEFPTMVFYILDQLWMTYSSGHFGFSPQKLLFENLRNENSKSDDSVEIYTGDFGELVGWSENSKWKKYDELTFSLQAPRGHLPYPSKRYSLSRKIYQTKAWKSFLILLTQK